jgi:pimeloyl-ACP methyl ester carboxylesterase
MAGVNKNVSFDHYLRDTSWQIEAWNKKRLFLVTHSIGACIGLGVAGNLRERLAGFVGISAAIPRPGHSFISCLPFPKRLLMPLMLKMAGTKPPDKQIAATLCNGLTEEQTDKVVNNFTAESPRLYLEKLRYSSIAVPSLYIELTDDQAFPLSRQRRMARRLHAGNTAEVPAGHLAMLSQPKELATQINQFVADVL